MAEIELNVLNNQCLGRRIKDIKTVKEGVAAWENDRNRIDKKIHWLLDIYKKPYDPLHPVVCMDESPKQLIGETRKPIPI